MAGVLYEVLGDTRFVPQRVCPAELCGCEVTLRPADGGEAVTLDAEAACLASKVKAHLLEKGPDAEVAVPLRRATLNKVVNYMRYHKATPPQDLCLPLASESLADCGASKWDLGFINVDIGLLFELVYASSALGLPTLNLLAKAKAATLMFGKKADQIRKEFNFANDLPKSEEEEILHMIGTLRQKRNLPWDEEQGVAPGAAIIGTVWPLAEAQEAKPGEAEQLQQRSWRVSSWRAAVAEDWRQLAHAPPQVRGDRGLVLAALAVSYGQALRHASAELRADREVALAAAAAGGKSVREAAAELRGDRDFILEAMRLGDGAALGCASEALRRDASLVLEATEAGCSAALQGATDILRRDVELVRRCTALDPRALLHAAESLRDDRSFAVDIVSTVPGALQYLPERFRADREVVEAAVARDPDALIAAHAARRREPLGDDAREAANVSLVQAVHIGPRQLGNDLQGERCGGQNRTLKLQKSVVFSALSTIMANMGQSNYIAANSFLDKMPAAQRPEVDSQCMMWGTIGGIGMRLKAFGSADFMLQQPDLLMTAREAAWVLHAICTNWGAPEWMGAQYIEIQAREAMLQSSLSVPGGYLPSEASLAYPSIPEQSKAASGRSATRDGAPFGEPRSRALPHRILEGSPLGGWPAIAGATPAPVAAAAARSVDASACAASAKQEEPTEGAMVRLVGLKSKSGLTGKVVKCYAEGRCRVALDGNKGSALLRPEYLEVLVAAIH